MLRMPVPKEFADKIEAADVEAFAWLLGLECAHDYEAEDAKALIVSLLRAHFASGRPTPEQIAFAIDNFEPDFIGGLANERETWIADNMRYEILQMVRGMIRS